VWSLTTTEKGEKVALDTDDSIPKKKKKVLRSCILPFSAKKEGGRGGDKQATPLIVRREEKAKEAPEGPSLLSANIRREGEKQGD